MAKINGVSIKGIKTFHGHDGPGYLQGNIYIDGKKAGFWSQDSWGGPDIFEFDTKELKARAVEYYTKHPDIDGVALYKMTTKDNDPSKIDFGNLPRKKASDMIEIESSLISDLLQLDEVEKWYKKITKKGLSMVGVLDFYHGCWPIPQCANMVAANNEDKIMESFREYTEKYPYAYVTFYRSLDDFNIVA